MITEAFDNITYVGTESADLIRNYKEYVDRVSKRYRLGHYNVSSGDRPDLVAYKIYGNPNLYWLIMYLNDVYDPFHGWTKDSNAVFEASKQKYVDMGGTDQVAFHRDINGEIYYDLIQHPIIKTNWYHKGDKGFRHIQYAGQLNPVPVNIAEDEYNDDKKTIKVVEPDDLRSFMEALQREVLRVKGIRHA